VTAEIPERMAPWIDGGRPVELLVDAYPNRTFTGKVTRISPAVNTGTRAFPFEAVVPNADGALKPGTFARVHVESAKVLRFFGQFHKGIFIYIGNVGGYIQFDFSNQGAAVITA
jgi:multidrug efflux pump subunit AcrA (membrane-fusion protein)